MATHLCHCYFLFVPGFSVSSSRYSLFKQYATSPAVHWKMEGILHVSNCSDYFVDLAGRCRRGPTAPAGAIIPAGAWALLLLIVLVVVVAKKTKAFRPEVLCVSRRGNEPGGFFVSKFRSRRDTFRCGWMRVSPFRTLSVHYQVQSF